MSREVSEVFITGFDAEVHRAYQALGGLRDSVRVKTGVVGSSYRFPKSGKGVATQHNGGNDVTAMNLDFTKVEAIMEDWEAFDYVDIYDIEKINFDEKKEIAYNTANAIKRREDQLIIDALYTSYSVGDTTTYVGDGSAVFSLDLVRSASSRMNDKNVPSENRSIIYSANQQQAFLGETETSSSDYNTVKALVAGEIKTFYGFDFTVIGSREEGGLPVPDTGEIMAFAYHKQAIGLAIGMDKRASVDWIAEKRSWLVGCDYSAGSVLIDGEGVQGIRTLAAASA